MAIEKINIGTNADGSPHYLYRSNTDAPLVITGPLTGTVELPDGSVYDVTDTIIEAWPGHELAIADAIGKRFEDEGHPGHDADQPFVATPVELTHDEDGTPSEVFAKAVETNAAPNRDSSPSGVIATVTKGKGA